MSSSESDDAPPLPPPPPPPPVLPQKRPLMWEREITPSICNNSGVLVSFLLFFTFHCFFVDLTVLFISLRTAFPHACWAPYSERQNVNGSVCCWEQ